MSVTPLVGSNLQSAKLVVAVPLDGVDGVDGTLSTLLLFEIAISSGITIIVLVATWLVVRRGMRPLERMGATARSIAATGLGSRVSPSTEKTEVGRLGLALNEMLGQIERAFAERDVVEQRLRHFVSDASHELRTPLTSMRGYAELLQRTPDMSREDVLLAVRRIEDETRRMGLLVDDLLLLARLDQRRPLDRAPVDLTSMINDAVSDARAADPGRTVIARIAGADGRHGRRSAAAAGGREPRAQRARAHTGGQPGRGDACNRRTGTRRSTSSTTARESPRSSVIASSSDSTAPTRCAAATRAAAVSDSASRLRS